MLLKDDQLIRNVGSKTKGKHDIEELNDLDLSRPVVFKLLDKFFKKDSHSGKMRGPRNILLEASYFVDEADKGVTSYRYYLSKARRGGQKGTEVYTEYTPEFVTMSGGKIVCDPKRDLDLIVFLLKHPKIAGGKNRSTDVKPIFYLDDPIIKNQKIAEDRALMVKVDSYIYGGELSEKELRNMASALMIPNVSSRTIAEIKNDIHKVSRANPEKVLSYVKPNKDVKIRTVIGKAQDYGYLRHVTEQNKWEVAADKESFTEVCKTTRADAPADRLIAFFTHNDDEGLLERLTELVKEEEEAVTA